MSCWGVRRRRRRIESAVVREAMVKFRAKGPIPLTALLDAEDDRQIVAKATLLLADKDPRSLRILELALRQASFEVVTAGDGAEALEAILSAPPDLVLCDLAVPGKDALAVCRAVRKEEKLAALPFLLMGGEKGASARARAIEAGADEYLAKPILLKELVQRVTMLLARRKLQEPDGPAALTGSVADLGLLDLFQSLENWRKPAV